MHDKPFKFSKPVQVSAGEEKIARYAADCVPEGSLFVHVGNATGASLDAFIGTVSASGKNIRVDAVNVLESAALEYPAQYELSYPPGSVDLVFLEEELSYRSTIQSILMWYPAVKVGGIIAGSGYSANNPNLMGAVDQCFGPDCAIFPNAWAICRGEELRGEEAGSYDDHLSYSPVMIPDIPRDQVLFDGWREFLRKGNEALDADGVPDALVFGEQAVETLLFLAEAEKSEVRYFACVALASFLTAVDISLVSRDAVLCALQCLLKDQAPAIRQAAQAAFRYGRTRKMVENRSGVAEAQVLLKAARSPETTVRRDALKKLKALPRELVLIAYRPVPGTMRVDCLDQAEFPAPTAISPHQCCVMTVALPGEERVLDQFLANVMTDDMHEEVSIVVFTPNPSDQFYEISEQHGAAILPYYPIGYVETAGRSVLCSAAKAVFADKYLCLDMHTHIRGPLSLIFDALDVLHENTLLINRSQHSIPDLSDRYQLAIAVTHNCDAEIGDENFLVGTTGGLDLRPVQADTRAFAGSRTALLELDRSVRKLQPFASAWIGGAPRNAAKREEAIIAYAIGMTELATEMRFGSPLQILTSPDIRSERV